MSDVIYYNRMPAIQLSETEFKYLTQIELVDIIQAKNILLSDSIAEMKLAAVTIKEQLEIINDLKTRLEKFENSNQKKGKRNGDGNDVQST
jgi:hypothetical protein